MNKKIVSFEIDSTIAEKFELALQLNKETANNAITQLMIDYCSTSFRQASNSLVRKSNEFDDDNRDYAKAKRKIPGWAQKPQQNNHRIIKAYFNIKDERGYVTVDALEERCSNPTQYPDTYSSDFRGNFSQMKTDAGKSHGKVFMVTNNRVEIWDEIENVLIEYKPAFIRKGSSLLTEKKITEQMIELAYENAKKVYFGHITRSEGKIAISEKSGMSPGSAQDYITVFLAMMEGKEYHRTTSNYGTEYFLMNIKKDFGNEAFQLAVEATEKHINYYNSLGYGQLKAKEDLVKTLK